MKVRERRKLVAAAGNGNPDLPGSSLVAIPA